MWAKILSEDGVVLESIKWSARDLGEIVFGLYGRCLGPVGR